MGRVQVGEKVTVRYKIGGQGPSGGPAMSDVVGELVEITDSTLRVLHRSGDIRDIDRSHIVTVHVIPRR